jgi:hypothetical protein
MTNGDVRVIAGDIIAGGVTAFSKGERVAIEGVDPNPQRPEYKYVVFSRLTGKRFQLRDADLEPLPVLEQAPAYGAASPVPFQPSAEPEQPYLSPGDAFQQGVMNDGPQEQFYSPGDAFQPTPGYQPAYRPPARAAGRRYGAPSPAKVMWYGIATGAAGFTVIVSTFLPWLSFLGFRGGSGWSTMLHGTGGGFSILLTGEGVLFFTGFWSIAVGLAIIAGVVLMFMRQRVGGLIAQIAGALGALFALTSMITAFSNSLTPAIGLWLFLTFSAAGAILAGVTLRVTR